MTRNGGGLRIGRWIRFPSAAIGIRPLVHQVGEAAAGLAIGLAGAVALGRWIESLLFGVSGFDPPTLVAVVTILVAAALAASYLPARRATRIDPWVILCSE